MSNNIFSFGAFESSKHYYAAEKSNESKDSIELVTSYNSLIRLLEQRLTQEEITNDSSFKTILYSFNWILCQTPATRKDMWDEVSLHFDNIARKYLDISSEILALKNSISKNIVKEELT